MAIGPHALVYPMFALALLTALTLARLFRTRSRFVREGQADARYFLTYQDGGEPEASAKLARHFTNLFEAPTLFYVACLAAMVTGQGSDVVIVALAWLYVAARVVHTWVHTGRNVLPQRIAAYFTSWAFLMLLWLWVVLGVASAG